VGLPFGAGWMERQEVKNGRGNNGMSKDLNLNLVEELNREPMPLCRKSQATLLFQVSKLVPGLVF
jgi:hypothetical protein